MKPVSRGNGSSRAAGMAEQRQIPVDSTSVACGPTNTICHLVLNTLVGGKSRASRRLGTGIPALFQNGKYRPTKPDDYGPDIYTQFIIDFIRRHQEEEFFVYFPMTLTHGPFLPTPHSHDVATANKFQSRPRYFGDMISYTGHCVSRIISALEELGIAEETLVIFTADNEPIEASALVWEIALYLAVKVSV